MGRGQRAIQVAVGLSRWLAAPFLLGLVFALLLDIYRFFADFYELAVGVLNLVDISLIANLVLIVIFSTYENFIQKLDQSVRDNLPEALVDIDFGALKQKILGSIVVISAVDALAWYLDLDKYTDTSKLVWALAFPLVLVVVMLMLAVADRLGRHSDGSQNG
jgi:uncharacterized protein (TIGR00645 family)